MENLKSKINIVIKEELRAYTANGRIRGGLGSFSVNLPHSWSQPGQIQNLISGNPGLQFVQSPNATLLIRLYSTLTPQQKEEYIRELLSYFSSNFPTSQISYLVFFILYRVGKIKEGLEKAKQNLPNNSIQYGDVLGMLGNILIHQYTSLSLEEINNLEQILDKDNEFNVLGRINSIKLKLLSDELDGINIEINEDKNKLVEALSRFKFPHDLEETLNVIDDKLNNATTTFDYKGCMDLIRSFTERFYQSIAKELDKENGAEMNEKNSEEVAKFFKKYGLISDDQGKILVGIRHFLSNFGSHRLKSKPEDARLSRNMTIEFSLYLTRRLDEMKRT